MILEFDEKISCFVIICICSCPWEQVERHRPWEAEFIENNSWVLSCARDVQTQTLRPKKLRYLYDIISGSFTHYQIYDYWGCNSNSCKGRNP